jgi:hypothetical protein
MKTVLTAFGFALLLTASLGAAGAPPRPPPPPPRQPTP